MKARIYQQVLQQLTELSINTEDNASVLLCYILAQMNIKYSSDSSMPDGIRSQEFLQVSEDFELPTPLPEYIHDVRFTALTVTLLQQNLDSDYYSFFEFFTPRLVSQWDKFNESTDNLSALDISVVVYLTLTQTISLQLRFSEITEKKVDEIYHRVSSALSPLKLTAETFSQIWESLYFIPMPKLKVGFSRKLVETVKFYRKHKVSGLALVKNYCQYNKHKTRLDEAFNPWSDFQREIKNSPAISGVSIEESAFNLIRSISHELPVDVIRAAIYPHPDFFNKSSGFAVKPNNDGRFECSFFLLEFERQTYC